MLDNFYFLFKLSCVLFDEEFSAQVLYSFLLIGVALFLLSIEELFIYSS